jgi:anti-anti-sigma factor
MPAVVLTDSSHRLALTGSSSRPLPARGALAAFGCRRLQSSIVVISAQGAIDASNAGTLTDYALGQMAGCRGLILDLRALDFIGTECFSTLLTVSASYARANTRCVVVAGGTFSRLLRICGPQSSLRAADTIEAAQALILSGLRVHHTSSRSARTPGSPGEVSPRPS